MIVRRFMNWLRLTVAASLGGAHLRPQPQHAREPVLVGSAKPSDASARTSPSLSLSSWLDNGRRLRPRLRLTPSREAGLPVARPLRMRTPLPPTVAPLASESAIPRISIAPMTSEPAEATPLAPVIHLGDEQSDDLSNLERLDAETRRLMVLRHLVRRRIFNEGFVGNDVPEQYHRSLGMETQPPEH